MSTFDIFPTRTSKLIPQIVYSEPDKNKQFFRLQYMNCRHPEQSTAQQQDKVSLHCKRFSLRGPFNLNCFSDTHFKALASISQKIISPSRRKFQYKLTINISLVSSNTAGKPTYYGMDVCIGAFGEERKHDGRSVCVTASMRSQGAELDAADSVDILHRRDLNGDNQELK